jgi:hypothetical protein
VWGALPCHCFFVQFIGFDTTRALRAGDRLNQR